MTENPPRKIHTFFPSWSRERLEEAAYKHYVDIAIAYGHYEAEPPSIDRSVVNMLRHEYSDYDLVQSQEAHRVVCSAIARRFLWLEEECQKQIDTRAAREEERQFMREMWEIEREEERDVTQERAAASREAIKNIKVGMIARAKIRGRIYTGTITKVARSRVTFDYLLKSGAERQVLIYASEIEIVDE